MARMTNTTQMKNITMPGIAHPATLLDLATTRSYPQSPDLFNHQREPSGAGSCRAYGPGRVRRTWAWPVGFKYSAMGPDLRLGERPSGWLCGRFVLADQAAGDLVAPDPVEWDRERDHMLIVAGCS